MNPREPTLAALPNPALRYFLATRPAFLAVTLTGCLLGLACAQAGGVALDPARAALTVVFALSAHAGANVLNDYYDARNGSDAANRQRLYPYTGGSRFIQNGVLSPDATRAFGYALLAAVVPAGLGLAAASGSGLLAVGIGGLLLAWAYSAPPLQLMSRGIGELAVGGGWLLVVVGTDFVQRQHFSALAACAGLSYALLVANVLFINQFPDALADRLAGKRTLVVRLGPGRARWLYPAIAASAYAALCAAVAARILPATGLLGLLATPLNLAAARLLHADAARPARLAAPIKLSIAAANVHGLLLCAGLLLA